MTQNVGSGVPADSEEGAGAPKQKDLSAFEADVADYIEGMHPEIGRASAKRAAEWIIQRASVFLSDG